MEPSAGYSLPIDDTIIFTAIAQIMREAGADQKGVYLSRIGQRLASHFGHPLRELLGKRRLREVIESSLGKSVKFEDSGPRMTARIEASLGSERRSLRFDPAFWAAFSKPIEEDCVRHFRNSKPFHFRDVNSAEELNDLDLLISPDDIADPEIPKPERDQQIRSLISGWCERNSLPLNDFILAKRISPTAAQDTKFNIRETSKIATLVNFIESIPAEERKNYTLSLDLIYRFIQS